MLLIFCCAQTLLPPQSTVLQPVVRQLQDSMLLWGHRQGAYLHPNGFLRHRLQQKLLPSFRLLSLLRLLFFCATEKVRGDRRRMQKVLRLLQNVRHADANSSRNLQESYLYSRRIGLLDLPSLQLKPDVCFLMHA